MSARPEENDARRYLSRLLSSGRVSIAERALVAFERQNILSSEGLDFYRTIIEAAKARGDERSAAARPNTNAFRSMS